MHYWHEPRTKERTGAVISESGRIHVCVRFPVDKNDQFRLFVLLWQKDDDPQPWQVAPEGWRELWPKAPIEASSLAKAYQLQLSLLDKLENEISYNDFEYRVPQLERVAVISHSGGKHQAYIYHYQDGKYEIRYFAFTTGRDDAWIQVRSELCTFTESFEDAQKIAQAEMDELAKPSRKRLP
ncbi:MAG: hypothetical protein KDE54_05655 [Caldilineaceae bacterium]|nr:hypothetical protein [Caldilineaceae bacterium]